MKSLEVSEEKANQRVEEFKRQLKTLTGKLKEAENRAELAEKTVKKLQKEVDRLEGTLSMKIDRQHRNLLFPLTNINPFRNLLNNFNNSSNRFNFYNLVTFTFNQHFYFTLSDLT